MVSLGIKIAAIALLTTTLIGGGYSVYNNIVEVGVRKGTEQTEQKYLKIIKGYEDRVIASIENIEATSRSLVEESNNNNEQLAADIKSIVKNIKVKPLITIKNGECIPSKTFSDTINSINQRVNQNIKDKKQ